MQFNRALLSTIFVLIALPLRAAEPADHFVENIVNSTLAKDFLFFSQPSERDSFLHYIRARGFQAASPVKLRNVASVGQRYDVQILNQKISFEVGLDQNQIKIGDTSLELSARLGSLSEKMKDDFDSIRIALALKVDRAPKTKFLDFLSVRKPASHDEISNASGFLLSGLDIEIANAAVAIEQTSTLYLSQWAYREQVWDQLCGAGNSLTFDWAWTNETYVRSKIAMVDEQVSRPYFYGLTAFNANAVLAEKEKLNCEDEEQSDRCALNRQKLSCFERILTEAPHMTGHATSRLPEDESWRMQHGGTGGPWLFSYGNASASSD